MHCLAQTLKARAFGTLLCCWCLKFLTSPLGKCQQLSTADRTSALQSAGLWLILLGRPGSAARCWMKEGLRLLTGSDNLSRQSDLKKAAMRSSAQMMGLEAFSVLRQISNTYKAVQAWIGDWNSHTRLLPSINQGGGLSYQLLLMDMVRVGTGMHRVYLNN